MKGELKAGGLALVVGNNPHAGKCVTLVRFVTPGQLFSIPTGGESFLSLKADPSWLVTGNVYPKGCEREQGWSLFAPGALMPIDGDDDQEPDQLTKDKPAELTA